MPNITKLQLSEELYNIVYDDTAILNRLDNIDSNINNIKNSIKAVKQSDTIFFTTPGEISINVTGCLKVLFIADAHPGNTSASYQTICMYTIDLDNIAERSGIKILLESDYNDIATTEQKWTITLNSQTNDVIFKTGSYGGYHTISYFVLYRYN